MPVPRTLVTRPESEAAPWVAALQARGLRAQALPLIAITAPTDAAAQQALHTARQHIARYDAVMVVSGNAAQHFFDQKTALALSGCAQAAIKTRVWAPGPGTARTLQALGLDAACIDQPAADAVQFDSEALWAQVQGQITPGARVLIVRGAQAGDAPAGSGRDWLAQQLRTAGAAVDWVAAYTRAAPQWTPAQHALAQQAASDGTLWLLSSSQAIAHLRAALPAQSWQAARALATHPRIAQAARSAGFGSVQECRPTLEDVAASIESAP